MKEVRFGTLKGLEAPILVYETTAEANAQANRKDGNGNPIDAVLEECNNNLTYRGPLADAREVVCHLLEEETGIEWPKKDSGRKDKDGKPVLVYIAEGEYANQVCVAKGWQDLKFLQGKLDERCRNMVETDEDGNPKRDESGNPVTFPLAVDITQKVRISKPKVLAAKYVDAAKKIKNVEKFLAAYSKEVGKPAPALTGDAEKDIKVLGWAAKELCEVRERAQLAAMPGTE